MAMLVLKNTSKTITLTLPPPKEMNLGKFDLTKSKRTSDGTMQMQYIATKRRLDVTWEYLTASQVQSILDFLASNKPFFYVEYEDYDGTREMLAYCGDIKYSPTFKKGSVRYFKSLSLSFIEV